MELNTQIAELAFPFPAKFFEEELDRSGIDYSVFNKDSLEGQTQSSIFYVQSSDFEKALKIKEKVEKEDAISGLNHIHPIRKVLSYISLILILTYLIYKYTF